MADYGKTLMNALRFSADPKRWVPLFALDTVFLSMAFVYLMSNIIFLSKIGTMAGEASFVVSLLGILAVLVIMFIVWFLLGIYVNGALIYQSFRPKEYRKSWKISCERYFSLLGVSFIVGVISGLVGMVPYVGWIFSIIAGLIFFFSMPAVIVGKRSFDRALSDSYNIFRKKTVEVFITWLLIGLVSLLIVAVFAMPLVIAFISMVLPSLIGLTESLTPAQVMSILASKFYVIVPTFLVLVVGMAISKAFSVNATTSFYQQLKVKG